MTPEILVGSMIIFAFFGGLLFMCSRDVGWLAAIGNLVFAIVVTAILAFAIALLTGVINF